MPPKLTIILMLASVWWFLVLLGYQEGQLFCSRHQETLNTYEIAIMFVMLCMILVFFFM